eukprot:TRINITY_DN4515_c0_g1_i3.p1 TRINITY_DN4515_c0_g1~~TRINITY_DN4515_c0_g1_i3.p1  ORF type:complete len:2070 (-),score=423.03 TRINITY_DN4515_c0_g1_i3:1571-6925(-)
MYQLDLNAYLQKIDMYKELTLERMKSDNFLRSQAPNLVPRSLYPQDSGHEMTLPSFENDYTEFSQVLDKYLEGGDQQLYVQGLNISKKDADQIQSSFIIDADLAIEERENSLKTILPDDIKSCASPQIKQILSLFDTPLKSITHKNHKYGPSVSLSKRVKPPIDVSDSQEEIELNDDMDVLSFLKNTEPSGRRYIKASVATQLTAPSPIMRTEQQITKLKENQGSVFTNFVSQLPDQPNDTRCKLNSPHTRPHVAQVFLEAKGIGFSIGTKEPFWVELAFYDTEKKVRVSEVLYAQFNDGEDDLKDWRTSLSQAFPNKPKKDAESDAKYAVFSFSYVSDHIQLVARVFNVFNGDTDVSCEPYIKGTDMSDKDRLKWQNDTLTHVRSSHLVKYKQGFAWGSIPAFKNGKLLLKESFCEIPLWKMKPFLSDNLFFESLSSTDKKARKLIDGKVVVNAKLFNPDQYFLENVHDFSLYKFPPPQREEDDYSRKILSQPVKLYYNFGQEFSKPYPEMTHFINNLYLYPVVVNFTNWPPKYGKVKNVLCRISILNSDESPNPSKYGIQTMFGRCDSANFVSTIDLPIQPNSKRVTFSDEIKIKLPLDVAGSERQHILFTFYNVTMKVKKDAASTENVIGYSFLPIFTPEKRYNDSNDLELKVYHELPSNYLSSLPYCVEDSKSSQLNVSGTTSNTNTAVAITIKKKIISSVFPHCRQLEQLFRAFTSEPTVDKKILEDLQDMDKWEAVEFFPVILSYLFQIISKESVNVNTQQIAFQKIITLLKWVDETGRQRGTMTNTTTTTTNSTDVMQTYEPLISSVIQYYFKDHLLYESVLKHWNTLINDAAIGVEFRQLLSVTMNEFANVFFGIIYKSMVLNVENMKKENNISDIPRSKRFSENTLELLIKLTRNLSSLGSYSNMITSKFNSQFAFFVNDLFHIADRGFVLDLVKEYLHGLSNDKKFQNLKLEFLRIVTDDENFLTLSNFYKNTSFETEQDGSITLKSWKDHYLLGSLFYELNSVMSVAELRSNCVRIIRNLLWKFDTDTRLNPTLKTILCHMFFPYMKIIISHSSYLIKEATSEEMKDWLICFVFLLRFSDSTLIRKWWKNESLETFTNIVELLSHTAEIFRVPPSKSKPAENLFSSMCFSIVEYLEYIIVDNNSNMKTEPYAPLFHKITSLIYLLIKNNSNPTWLETIFQTFSSFLFEFKSQIFRSNKSTYLIETCSELLGYTCFHENSTVVSQSATLVFSMMKANWIEMQELLHTKMCLTVAIHKICNEKVDIDFFDSALHHLLRAAQNEKDKIPNYDDWLLHVTDILGRLYRIIFFTHHLQSSNDPEYVEEIYTCLLEESSHSLECRASHLDKLSMFHLERGNFEEVAQCKVYIAALVASYLRMKGEMEELAYADSPSYNHLPTSYNAFKLVAPNISTLEPIHQELLFESVGPLFHEKGYTDTIQEAIDSMVKANVFEEGVELLAILFQLHKATGVFSKLANVGQQLETLAEKATEAIESNTRLFSKYYRVRFFGPKFEEMNGQKYVYRESAAIRLVDFSNRLIEQYTTQFGEEVKTLPNKSTAELQSMIVPNKHYLQVIAVDPFYDQEKFKNKKNVSTFDKQHCVDKYGFEAPWDPEGGKPSDEISKAWKLRTVFVVPQYFPNIIRRLRVVDENKIPIGPLDCAIDLIESRTDVIKLELQLKVPNTKTLQIVLQGSIMLQVNAGPKAIIEYFLGNKEAQEKYDPKKLSILKEKLTEFIRKCEFALRLNQKLIQKDQEEYQKALMEHFKPLKTEALKFLDV